MVIKDKQESADCKKQSRGLATGSKKSDNKTKRDCSESLVGGWGVWAMAGVQGKVAFGLSLFVY